MKVYLVEQSYRDWDEGWDTVLEVYLDKEKAQRKVDELIFTEEGSYSYYLVAKEVTE